RIAVTTLEVSSGHAPFSHVYYSPSRFLCEAVLYTLVLDATRDRNRRTGQMGQPNSKKGFDNIDRAWAILFARLVLGLIFFMAGLYMNFTRTSYRDLPCYCLSS